MPGISVSDAALNEALPSAVSLETLLSIVATNAANQAIATNAARQADLTPPPQVTVRYKNHAILYSRDVLQSIDLKVLFAHFTQEFDLASNPKNGKHEWEFVSIYGNVEYIPMKLYVTFLSGPGTAEKKDQEVSDWGASWKGLVPNIDEIHIFTMPEHQERREREEREAEQHARGE